MRSGWEEIPRKYFATVKRLQQELNNDAIKVTDSLPRGETVTKESMHAFVDQQHDHEISVESLLSLREIAAKIRSDGWIAGHTHELGDPRRDIEESIKESNPYPRGTGASECWVRGYCQGRSRKKIVDPAKYMEAA